MAHISIGQMIADKYCIERALDRNGHASLFLARHRELDQPVAIRFLLPDMTTDIAAERFRREVRAASQIRSEHVCQVLDVGLLEPGVPYMVMEYLEGCDLASELVARERLPPDEAFLLLAQACDAIGEAHAAGLVHRNLKLTNLFLAERPDGTRQLKVLDFGVSKSMLDARSGRRATTVSMSLGSPLYLAPEQLDSAGKVDQRCDIWALGVMFYELLSGTPPFVGDSIPRLVRAVLEDEPRPLSELELPIALPAPFIALIERALRKRPEERYGSIEEMMNALAELGPLAPPPPRRITLPPPAPVLGQPAPPVEPIRTIEPWRTFDGPERSPVRRKPRRVLAIAAAMLIAAFAGAVYRFAQSGLGAPLLAAPVAADARERTQETALHASRATELSVSSGHVTQPATRAATREPPMLPAVLVPDRSETPKRVQLQPLRKHATAPEKQPPAPRSESGPLSDFGGRR